MARGISTALGRRCTVVPGFLAGLVVLAVACTSDDRPARHEDAKPAPAEHRPRSESGYFDHQADSMADEDAQSVQPEVPPPHRPGRRPEPIQPRQARPMDQPRMR